MGAPAEGAGRGGVPGRAGDGDGDGVGGGAGWERGGRGNGKGGGSTGARREQGGAASSCGGDSAAWSKIETGDDELSNTIHFEPADKARWLKQAKKEYEAQEGDGFTRIPGISTPSRL